MNQNILTYRANAARFSAVVAAAPSADSWSGSSPCTGWTAEDVLHHVVDSQRNFLRDREANLEPKAEGSPAEVWTHHLQMIETVAADEEFVSKEYDGYFGRTSIAETLANFYGFDLAVHRWDMAQGLGLDVTFDDAELDWMERAIAGFGPALYSEGVCGPAIETPGEAPRQVRILGLLGRKG